MRNLRLQRAMLRASMTPAQLAQAAGVSEKSVRRWLTGTSVPHLPVRYRVAGILQDEDRRLWPDDEARSGNGAASEGAPAAIHAWQTASDVPATVPVELVQNCVSACDVMFQSGGLPMLSNVHWIPLLERCASQGATVRAVVDSPPGKADAELEYAALEASVVDIRCHRSALAQWLVRSDDEIVICPAVPGVPAARAPVFHCHRGQGTFFDSYIASFEAVWAAASRCFSGNP